MNHPRSDSGLMFALPNPPKSIPNHTQSAVDRRSTKYLSSNFILSRPKPECARLASAVHRDVVPTTLTNTRSRPAIITHTHTHTRTRTRETAGLCMSCGLHSVGQRMWNSDSNSSACATEGGWAEFAGRAQRRVAARRAAAVGACAKLSDRVEFGASRTRCDGRLRMLCPQGKSEVRAGMNSGE